VKFLSYFSIQALVLISVISLANAQENKESKGKIDKRCLIFNGFTGLSVPGNDLVKDYGTFGEIGGGVMFQSKSKWLFGLDFSYFFGNGVKKDPVANLRNEEGQIIGNNGSYATFKVFQRGFQFPHLKFGRTFALRKNPIQNSFGGLTLISGIGWFQHWTYIQDLSKKTPQFSKDYINGYDRMTNGPSVGFWVGYLFIPNRSKINFHLEGGYFASFTKTKRYDFANNFLPNEKRVDSMVQLRLRICFTVRSKAEEEYYYY
jgi:hypothetical protein